MIKSMTGFGAFTLKSNNKTFTVEIKSINAKQFDFSTKLPLEFRDKENEIRKLICLLLERGKIECIINIDNETDSTNNYVIDSDLVKSYFKDLKQIAEDLSTSISDSELLSIAMNVPDVITTSKPDNIDQDWDILQEVISEACRITNLSRENEGKILEADFETHIELILKYLTEIEPFESDRINSIKTRLLKTFKEYSDQMANFDTNRFEQELIFYLEKLDFTEEKVRLVQHCQYFIETMKENTSNGKKLSFICQEIGREINTLGSKSSEANIQKRVVQMKDELEKIKEQLANIL